MSRRFGIPLGMTFVCLLTVACSTAGAAVAGRAQSGLAASARPAPGGVLSTETDVTTTKAVTLNGAGANSIEPFFQRVFYDYNKLDPLTTVTYPPAGSSVGITDIEQNTVNFGDSEVPMAATDLAQETAGPILQIPVDLGGVAISYNIPGIGKQRLKLDGPTLARIFDGTITNWDDPAIAQASGITDLPDLRIVPVHRADPQARATTSTSTSSTPLRLGQCDRHLHAVQDVAAGQGRRRRTAQHGRRHLRLPDTGRNWLHRIRLRLRIPLHERGTEERRRCVRCADRAVHRPGWSERDGSHPVQLQRRQRTRDRHVPTRQLQLDARVPAAPNLAEGIALGKLLYWVVTKGQRAAVALGYAPLPANVQRLCDAGHRASGELGGQEDLCLLSAV